MLKSRLITALGAAFAIVSAFTARAEVTALTGATVHTAGSAGVIENATVLIEDGRIRAVGANVAVPVGAITVDAAGKVITPGLIDSYSRLGLVEISAAHQSVDYRLKDYEVGPAFSVFYGVNPDSTVIPVSRIEGITRSVVAPAASVDMYAGQGASIHLGNGENLVINPSVAVFASLGGSRHTGGSRAAALARLKQSLEEARHYDAHRKAYERGEHREYLYGRADLEALVPVVKGKKPLAVVVNRSSDILHVLAIAREMSVKLVLIGATEGWRVAPRIAAAGVPVILSPTQNLPESFDGLAATLENAAKLHAAGVTIAIGSEAGGFSGGGTHNARAITQLAGVAVAYGLPWDAALKALTVNGAKIWGLDRGYGTIETGKDADIVVWTGDPLELDSRPVHVFIRGELIELTSRQTRLRDRYMNLRKAQPPFAYRR
ncbi:MAG: amidohydrolase family protein [Sphingomonadales bacterium]